MLPRPNRLFVAGLILVVIGAVLPFLIVIGVVPNRMWLSFLAYFSSIIGLFLGILSAATYVEEHRRSRNVDKRDSWVEDWVEEGNPDAED